MGKKKNREKVLLKEANKQREEIDREISGFYEDGILANAQLVSVTEPFTQFYTTLRDKLVDQSLSDDEMEKRCSQIRNKVKKGTLDSIEINLMKGVHRYKGIDYSLGDAIIKVLPWNAQKPEYLYMRAEDTAEALIFLGGDDAQAFLVIKDEKGAISYVRLEEFHLLSIQETPDHEEVGLMTSFVWVTARVYSTVVKGLNLHPIKNLLLAESFQNKIEKERSEEG